MDNKDFIDVYNENVNRMNEDLNLISWHIGRIMRLLRDKGIFTDEDIEYILSPIEEDPEEV